MRKMSKIKVAITGTIGSGKSEVIKHLKDKGEKVFVADEYNASLLKKGTDAYFDIIHNFDVLDKDKNIDKTKLAQIVFNDRDKLKLLETFTTKRIIEKIKELINEDEITFFEVPLLYELNLDILFDKVIVITADEDLRIKRLIKRGISEVDAKKRISTQLDDQVKIEKADYVIYNNSNLDELYNIIDTLLKDLR